MTYVIKAVLGYRKTDPTPAAERPKDPATKKVLGPRRKLVQWEGSDRQNCSWEPAEQADLDPDELVKENLEVKLAGSNNTQVVLTHTPMPLSCECATLTLTCT